MSTMSRSKQISDCIGHSSLFDLLNISEQKLIKHNHKEAIFNPGENIFKKGTPGTHVLVFIEGMAKFYLEGRDRNIIIRLIKVGEVLSAPGSMLKTMLPFSVSAIEKTRVCFIENTVFRQAMKSNIAFREQFLENIHQNLSQIIEKLVSLNTKNNPGRLAETLLYLSDEIYQSPRFTLTISRKELAELTGISKESAFKILKKLDRENIIEREENSIEIRKPDLLYEISLRG